MEKSDIQKLAKEANGQVWNYLQQEKLGADEPVQMLACAYASLYLWARGGGTALNFARAHWLIGRVACVLNNPALALKHAEMCGVYTELSEGRKDFDEGYRWEALARAQALNGDKAQARELKARAQALGEKIVDPEDKEIYLSDLASGPWFGI